jgi:hypothetical protein
MSGNINIKIDKLPESPWFWILVAIIVFLVLLGMEKPATAVTFLFLAISFICFVFNLIAFQSSEPSTVVWWICGVCLVLGVIVGLLFVTSEWQPPIMPIPHPIPPVETPPSQ